MIGLDPDIVWRVFGGKAEINRRALADPGGFSPCAGPPLCGLGELMRRIADETGVSPNGGGASSAISGYDMVRQMERLAEESRIQSSGVPMRSCAPDRAVVFDAVKDEIFVVTAVRPDRNSAFSRRPDRALPFATVVATLEARCAELAT